MNTPTFLQLCEIYAELVARGLIKEEGEVVRKPPQGEQLRLPFEKEQLG